MPVLSESVVRSLIDFELYYANFLTSRDCPSLATRRAVPVIASHLFHGWISALWRAPSNPHWPLALVPLSPCGVRVSGPQMTGASIGAVPLQLLSKRGGQSIPCSMANKRPLCLRTVPRAGLNGREEGGRRKVGRPVLNQCQVQNVPRVRPRKTTSPTERFEIVQEIS